MLVVQIRYSIPEYNRLKKCVFLCPCHQLQLCPVSRTPSSSLLWWLLRGPSSSSSWCLASSLGEGTLSRAPLTLRSCESALVNYILSFTGLHFWSPPHTHAHSRIHQHGPVACCADRLCPIFIIHLVFMQPHRRLWDHGFALSNALVINTRPLVLVAVASLLSPVCFFVCMISKCVSRYIHIRLHMACIICATRPSVYQAVSGSGTVGGAKPCP